MEHIKLKIDNTLKPNKRKMYLYSGHENNVINILAALGIAKVQVVEFSSAAIIELHYLGELNTHAIKVIYSYRQKPLLPIILNYYSRFCSLDLLTRSP